MCVCVCVCVWNVYNLFRFSPQRSLPLKRKDYHYGAASSDAAAVHMSGMRIVARDDAPMRSGVAQAEADSKAVARGEAIAIAADVPHDPIIREVFLLCSEEEECKLPEMLHVYE